MNNEQTNKLSNANQNHLSSTQITYGIQISFERLCELIYAERRYAQLQAALKKMGLWEDVIIVIENPDKYFK